MSLLVLLAGSVFFTNPETIYVTFARKYILTENKAKL